MVKTAYLGIDVSKGYADFHLLDDKEKVIEENFQLADNRDGRSQLIKLIEDWMSKGLEKLYCGVESTGGYENNWYVLLRRFGDSKENKVAVCRLNPKGVKSVGEASLKRTITDAVSAHSIALYLIKFKEKVDYGNEDFSMSDEFRYGRQHNTTIRLLQKQKVQLSNQLEKLLYQYFPEILTYCRNGLPLWLLQLLANFPSAEIIVKAGSGEISKIKGITSEKAEKILMKAKQSDLDSASQVNHVISMTAKEIIHKDYLIQEEKSYLRNEYVESEEVKLLCTIPGIGADSAISLILEIENIKRFPNAKKLAAYFGISPTFKQSGDGKWGAHMSKQGRGQVRAILYMSILSGIRFNPILKNSYARFRAKGMCHKQAAGVIMHKLLRIVFGVMTTKKPFAEEIDLTNQIRATERQKALEVEKAKVVKENKKNAQRFSPIFIDAPISRRKDQSRKKMENDLVSERTTILSEPLQEE